MAAERGAGASDARCNPEAYGVHVEHGELTMESVLWTVHFSGGSFEATFSGMQSWDWSSSVAFDYLRTVPFTFDR